MQNCGHADMKTCRDADQSDHADHADHADMQTYTYVLSYTLAAIASSMITQIPLLGTVLMDGTHTYDSYDCPVKTHTQTDDYIQMQSYSRDDHMHITYIDIYIHVPKQTCRVIAVVDV